MSNLNERCGIILATGEIIETLNTHPDPYNNFIILEENLLIPGVVATFHTHPRTGPNLSVNDYFAFMAFPKLQHFVIAKDDIWCFHTINGILCRYENVEIPRLLSRIVP